MFNGKKLYGRKYTKNKGSNSGDSTNRAKVSVVGKLIFSMVRYTSLRSILRSSSYEGQDASLGTHHERKVKQAECTV